VRSARPRHFQWITLNTLQIAGANLTPCYTLRRLCGEIEGSRARLQICDMAVSLLQLMSAVWGRARRCGLPRLLQQIPWVGGLAFIVIVLPIVERL
jgi:hypothetical protein